VLQYCGLSPHGQLAGNSVTTFLEFLETWKCQGILQRSLKWHKVRERSGNLRSQGYLIVTPQQYARSKTLMF